MEQVQTVEDNAAGSVNDISLAFSDFENNIRGMMECKTDAIEKLKAELSLAQEQSKRNVTMLQEIRSKMCKIRKLQQETQEIVGQKNLTIESQEKKIKQMHSKREAMNKKLQESHDDNNAMLNKIKNSQLRISTGDTEIKNLKKRNAEHVDENKKLKEKLLCCRNEGETELARMEKFRREMWENVEKNISDFREVVHEIAHCDNRMDLLAAATAKVNTCFEKRPTDSSISTLQVIP
jgi:chromosome segregation ATPase